MYYTLTSATAPVTYKVKKSKFIALAYPVSEALEVKPILAALKKTYPTAGHFCYAWRLGSDPCSERSSDDGEPRNTAGMPILGQIRARNLTNVLVIVIRIFGGVKLGTGGLIQAYKTAAELALADATIVQHFEMRRLTLCYQYAQTPQVMRIIKKWQLQIIEQQFKQNCQLKVMVTKEQLGEILVYFENIPHLTVAKD
ncbi:MAG: YigZ family protein [Bacteroidota bacterium]